MLNAECHDGQEGLFIFNALDEATFTVVKRELMDAERADYEIVKKHLLKRFDLLKDAGQKRLILRQA